VTTRHDHHPIKLPLLTLKAVQQRAQEFLALHNPAKTIPTPIEEIVELKLGISIIPVPDLRRTLGIDAYLSHNAERIIVDRGVYEGNENRTRFSVTHEVSHVVLHKDFYIAHAIQTPEGILGFQMRLNREDRKFMEVQAHTFAAHLLMPPDVFNAYIEDVQESAGPIEGFTITDAGALVYQLSDKFAVSEQAVIKHFKHHSPQLHQLFNQD
jgi:hypothetical protein